MIAAKDIKDRDTLEQWLTEWPESQGMDEDAARKVAVSIAHRAAMRVFPIAWIWFSSAQAREHDLTALPFLRCLLSSGITNTPLYVEMVEANRAANTYALDYLNSAARINSSAAEKAGNAAAKVASVFITYAFGLNSSAFASSTVSEAAEAYVRDVSSAAAPTTRISPVRATKVFWEHVQKDALAFELDDDLARFPLWTGKPLNWFNLKLLTVRENTDNEAPIWDFWLRWWKGAILGDSLSGVLLTQIAFIPDEDWKQGPTHIAELIAKIEKKIKSTHNLEVKGINQAKRPSSIQRIEAMEAMLEGLEIDGLSEKLRASSSDIEALSHEAERLSESVEKSEASFASIRKRNGESLKMLDQQRDKILDVTKELEEQFEARFEAALSAFREEQAVKEPVQLWTDKQVEHEGFRDTASKMFLIGIGGIALVIAVVIGLLMFGEDGVASLLQSDGCDFEKRPDFCNRFSMKGLVVSGSFLTLITLALWFTRLQMKIYLSERHLALDARERRAFAQAYIGLLAEDASSEEAKQQRAMVYNALFRPSTDGIVKEEGGLDPSISAAISKALS